MWIYGDRDRAADPQTALRRGIAAWNRGCRGRSGIESHGHLVAAHADLSGLLQGVADAAFAENGRDEETAATRALGRLLLETAKMIDASRRETPATPIAVETAALISRLLPKGPVVIRDAEGFAHYAFYPEAWIDAARLLPPGRWHVIGLRSIGTALAPMAAVPLALAGLTTLRPVGPHFARAVRPGPGLLARWGEDRNARFVIVDEGPGLSGSSFCAVITRLLELGVAPDHIHVMPSHPEPLGRAASAEHRVLWERMERIPAEPHRVLATGSMPLSVWFEDVTGPAPTVTDLSGGGWRTNLPRGFPAPASNVSQERLKFRLDGAGGSRIAKFAGIGRIGRTKYARARALAEAGFVPPVHALRHGFLLEERIVGRPLRRADLTDQAFRERFLRRVAAYLGFRARAFPVAPDDGAPPALLLDSALYNIERGMGAAAARRMARAAARFDVERLRIRRIATDGRLDLHEWLIDARGRILKTDAVDHAMTHDLVGAQDVSWDVAGAASEFDLDHAEILGLAAAIDGQAGLSSDRNLLQLMLLLYPAFRYAAARLAIDCCPAEETQRLEKSARDYAAAFSKCADQFEATAFAAMEG